MSGNAIVLGSRPDSGNIGNIISRQLRGRGWLVTEDDCHQSMADIYAPPESNLSIFDACVITLGYTTLTPMKRVNEHELDKVIYGSLILPLLCARKYIQDRESRGKIIFTGSYAHDHALTGCAAYCAAKAGLAAAAKEMAWELTPEFLVWIVHPYHVPSTPMGSSVVQGMMDERGMTRPEAEAYQRKDLKMSGHLRPLDIAKIVCWILRAPEAAWLSGAGLNLYGGVR